MGRNKYIYCQDQFLKLFFEAKPKLYSVDDEALLVIRNWLSLYEMLHKSVVFLDISQLYYNRIEQEQITKTDRKPVEFKTEYIHLLYSLKNRGGGLKFLDDRFPDISSSHDFSLRHKNSFFLTTLETDACQHISKNNGCLCLNLEMILHDKKLFVDSGIPLPNPYLRENGDIVKIFGEQSLVNNTWCNTILIVDNYLVRCVDHCWLNNIEPILRKLIENNPVNDLYLSVFSPIERKSKDENGNVKEIPYNFVEKCKALIKKVHALSESLNKNVKVTVYNSTNYDFHDRVILTNNLWIGCGKGFSDSLVGPKVNMRPSSITLLYPFAQTATNWCDGAYISVMKSIIKVFNKCKKKDIDYWGDDGSENPLIQYYKKELHL